MHSYRRLSGTQANGPDDRHEGARLLARTLRIGLSEAHHGPAGDRRFDYAPTYLLRGLNELHLTFAAA